MMNRARLADHLGEVIEIGVEPIDQRDFIVDRAAIVIVDIHLRAVVLV